MKEVVIYVHGIAPAPKPENHKQIYDTYHNLLSSALRKRGKSIHREYIGIEWGHESQNISTDDRKVWELTRSLCVHNCYFDTLEKQIHTVKNQFQHWEKPNDTLHRLCAII